MLKLIFPYLLVGIGLLSPSFLMAQPGPIKNLRYEDDFSYLLNDSVQKKGSDRLKYLWLNSEKGSYLSLGGELREWYEIRLNSNFGDVPPGVQPDNDGALLHRLMIHADWWLGKRLRAFGQLNQTWEFGSVNEPIPEISQDGLSVHQAFVELYLDVKSRGQGFLRLGRQELSFGNELVISSREGPNNRLTFDGASYIHKRQNFKLHALVATPVIIDPYAFDNYHINEWIWGVYSTWRQQKSYKLDAYYFGFDSDRRNFNGITGRQTRHTVGARLWQTNPQKHVYLDLEAMYQFGQINQLRIQAFNISGDFRYLLHTKWKPAIGMGFSYVSGDYSASDGQLNTYDPMYPKPIYGLAVPIGPANVSHIRPFVGIQPVDGWIMNVSVYLLARASNQDGTYAPSMVMVRPFPGASSEEHYIGTQYSYETFYVINKHLTLIHFLSYVSPGTYVNETGKGEPIGYVSLAVQYKF